MSLSFVQIATCLMGAAPGFTPELSFRRGATRGATLEAGCILTVSSRLYQPYSLFQIAPLAPDGKSPAGCQLAQNDQPGLPQGSPVCVSVRPIQPAATSRTVKEGGGSGRHADPINSGSRLARVGGTWRSLKTRADKELRCRVQLPHKGSNDRSRAGVGQPTPLN